MNRLKAKLDEANTRAAALMVEIDAAARAKRQLPRGPESDAADRHYTRLRWTHSEAKADAAMWRKELRRMERAQAQQQAS